MEREINLYTIPVPTKARLTDDLRSLYGSVDVH